MIDIYFVAPIFKKIRDQVINELHCNVLFSYFSSKKELDELGPKIKSAGGKVFVDSGAFSAWTRGVSINVDEYIEWLNNREFIDLFGQLDVIPGNKTGVPTNEQVKNASKATWENYLYMRTKLKSPEKLLYTFHVGEPIEMLKQALEWKDENGNPIQYIALGGMVGKPANTKERFLDLCFEVIKASSNPNVKVHTFGMTSKDLLSKYPITSADSSSWAMTGANGNIIYNDSTIAITTQHQYEPNYYTFLPEEDKQRFIQSIKDFGFNIDEIVEDYNQRALYNIKYMKKTVENIVYRPKAQTRLF